MGGGRAWLPGLAGAAQLCRGDPLLPTDAPHCWCACSPALRTSRGPVITASSQRTCTRPGTPHTHMPPSLPCRGRRPVCSGPDPHQPRRRRARVSVGLAARHAARGGCPAGGPAGSSGRQGMCRRVAWLAGCGARPGGGWAAAFEGRAAPAARHVRRRCWALHCLLAHGLFLPWPGPAPLPAHLWPGLLLCPAAFLLQVTQHGACLGLGIAALGTEDEEAFEDVKNVLYMDNAGG